MVRPLHAARRPLFLQTHGIIGAYCYGLRRGKKEESKFFHSHGNQLLSFLFFLQSPEEIEGPTTIWVYLDFSLSRSMGLSLFPLNFLLGILLFTERSFFRVFTVQARASVWIEVQWLVGLTVRIAPISASYWDSFVTSLLPATVVSSSSSY
jgi:hypothetical protein